MSELILLCYSLRHHFCCSITFISYTIEYHFAIGKFDCCVYSMKQIISHIPFFSPWSLGITHQSIPPSAMTLNIAATLHIPPQFIAGPVRVALCVSARTKPSASCSAFTSSAINALSAGVLHRMGKHCGCLLVTITRQPQPQINNSGNY